ncbi:hypothetical protein AN958_09401 [Leucoagaricus sp. SymC.cos]|nr:hypothetical protein AN958_09401 [Leucoagaricus sp. SymC.cos]
MSSSSTIDYASLLGIESLPAAVIFTILYSSISVFYIWRTITNFNFVLILVTIFCLIRVVGFAIRAALTGSASAGSDLSVVVADQVLFGAGFTALLFAIFNLETDRERIAGIRFTSPLMTILTNERVFRFFIAAAAALTIVGTIKISDNKPSDQDLGNALRQAGVWLLFVVTIVAALRAVFFIYFQRNSTSIMHKPSIAEQHAGTLLLTIAGLMIIRMVYVVVVTTKKEQQNEASWYPLSALPEFLDVCVFATPGLVLSRTELKEKDIQLEGYRSRPISGSPIVV